MFVVPADTRTDKILQRRWLKVTVVTARAA